MEIQADYSLAPILKPGRYEAELHNWEQKKAASTGSSIISWTFLVTAPQRAAGAKLFHNTPLSGPGAGLTRQLLLAFDPAYTEEPFDPNHYMQKRIAVRVNDRVMPDGSPSPFPQITAVFPIQTTDD